MGAGHADQVTAGGKERQHASELRFLAAHDVGRFDAALGEAGQDADFLAPGPNFDPEQAPTPAKMPSSPAGSVT